MVSLKRSPRLTTLVFLVASMGLVAVACGDDEMAAPDPPPVVNPGSTLPVGTTVRVNTSGDYQLPQTATTLTTRCTGSVAVTFETTPGSPQTNTCDSATGSSNMTNIITGASSVTYVLGTGAFADVTVN